MPALCLFDDIGCLTWYVTYVQFRILRYKWNAPVPHDKHYEGSMVVGLPVQELPQVQGESMCLRREQWLIGALQTRSGCGWSAFFDGLCAVCVVE